MNVNSMGALVRARQAGNVIKLLSIAAVVCAMFAVAPHANAALAYALTDNNRLLRFDTATPGVLTGVAPISGRFENEDLIGIDFRPSDTQLYAVGESRRLYTINLSTAQATVLGQLAPAAGDPFTFLQGSRFGFDFNPQADRLRITSDTRQNLRVNPLPNSSP